MTVGVRVRALVRLHQCTTGAAQMKFQRTSPYAVKSGLLILFTIAQITQAKNRNMVISPIRLWAVARARAPLRR